MTKMSEIRDLIEEIGYVNDQGVRVYGSAAYLHFCYLPVSKLSRKDIEAGKNHISKLLK